ncbi:MAG: DUF4388 domain-containing protein [Deltaproteobacteria bacterium]|nr:MAG: DUF4388 domain-containing protein [Deltaproteobacteria bacterium]
MSRALLATHLAPADVARLRTSLAPLGLVVVRGDREFDRDASANDEGVSALVDLDEPDAEGAVVRLRERFPDLVVLGAAKRPRGETLVRAARLGVDGIVAWPADPATVERLTRRRLSGAGATGTCGGISSAELLELRLRAREDGVLVFWRDDAPDYGCFHLEGGQVIHAVAGRRVGVEAAREILSWKDVRVRFLCGRTGAPRTILGTHAGLVAPVDPGDGDGRGHLERVDAALAVAFPQVVAKMAKIAAMPQVVGAFLLQHGEVTHGRAAPGVDESALRRAVQSVAVALAEIVGATPMADTDPEPSEIQATAAGLRIIVDRVGPPEAGVQAGVAVYQAASISKSLRRLIRQVDRAFKRAMERAQRHGGSDEAA